MSKTIRDVELSAGHNFMGLSAEHDVIGVWRDYATGLMYLTVAENTQLSDDEEGLVYRDFYIAICGEVLPFDTKNAFEHDLLPGVYHYQTMVMFAMPATKDRVLH